MALPASAVLSNAFNYVVSIPILIAFCWMFGIAPGRALLLLPLALLQMLLLALGLALIAACLTPFFRDLIQLLEVAFVGWFFATPVLYPTSLPRSNLSETAFRLYELNPMAGVVSLVRVAFLGEEAPVSTLAISWAGTALVLVAGVWLFRRLESRLPTAV
jgi:ABC-type polysaccharide/polyol phosphate export permease